MSLFRGPGGVPFSGVSGGPGGPSPRGWGRGSHLLGFPFPPFWIGAQGVGIPRGVCGLAQENGTERHTENPQEGGKLWERVTFGGPKVLGPPVLGRRFAPRNEKRLGAPGPQGGPPPGAQEIWCEKGEKGTLLGPGFPTQKARAFRLGGPKLSPTGELFGHRRGPPENEAPPLKGRISRGRDRGLPALRVKGWGSSGERKETRGWGPNCREKFTSG